jgi:hypothetical protein
MALTLPAAPVLVGCAVAAVLVLPAAKGNSSVVENPSPVPAAPVGSEDWLAVATVGCAETCSPEQSSLAPLAVVPGATPNFSPHASQLSHAKPNQPIVQTRGATLG